MTYMFEIVVKRDLVAGSYRLPAGLSVRVLHDQMSSPLNSTAGKQRIAQAFSQQYGIDMNRAMNYISTAYMDAYRM